MFYFHGYSLMVLKAFDNGFIFVLTASVCFSYIRDKNQLKKKQDQKTQQLGGTNETGTAYTCLRGIRVVQCLVFCVVFCTLVYRYLSFFFWPLFCLSIDLQLLITPLLSSNVIHTIQLRNIVI